MEKRTTLKDVAARAGVTTATVSYVLNKKKPISEETCCRVLKAVDELEYIPNLAARSLAKKGSGLIGVVIPQTEKGGYLMLHNTFYSEILGSIEFSARNQGYHVLISATDVDEAYFTLAKERNLDGIIVIGMYRNEFYDQMKKSKIPVVLIDSYCEDYYFHNIRIDDAYGSYLATEYMIENGHREIAFFSGQIRENGVMKKRLLGYEQALSRYKLPFRSKNIIEGRVDYDSGVKMAYSVINRKSEVTGIVAAADVLAIGAMKGFADHGYQVPEDISMVGFDDSEIAGYLVPGLTTVRQDIRKKGERAFALLLKNIQDLALTKREEILPVYLVIRGSVKNMTE